MHQDVLKVLYSEQQLAERCKQLGQQITADYKNSNHEIVVVGILRGSLPFMADLVRNIELDIVIDFMAVSSYEGTQSTGGIRIKKDLEQDITGKDVIVVEDIVDTGLTLSELTKMLYIKGAHDVKIACLLNKEARRTQAVNADYVGFNVGDEFVIGYGLDFNQKYRNLPFIGVLKEECYK